MKTKLLLPLNLQFFAEGDPPPPADPPPKEEAKFTQEDLERIIGERLARQQEKTQKQIDEAKQEAERAKLEEDNEYKALYESEKVARERVERERQTERLEQTKLSLLVDAGYTSDKISDVLALVVGDDEDAVKASVERIVKVAPPKAPPVDPSHSGGQRQSPQQNDGGYEAAREKARKLLKRK